MRNLTSILSVFFILSTSLLFGQSTSIGLSVRNTPYSNHTLYDFSLESSLNKRSSIQIGVGRTFPEVNNRYVLAARIGYKYKVIDSKIFDMQVGLTYNPNTSIAETRSYITHDLLIPVTFNLALGKRFSIFTDIGYGVNVANVFYERFAQDPVRNTFRGSLGVKMNFN